jgi:hypothetical protein
MQRGLKTVEAAVGPLVLNALVSGRDMVLGTHKVNADALVGASDPQAKPRSIPGERSSRSE